MFETELNQSLDYLNSEAAIKSLAIDPYWPKWNSPWWHMLLLHEMGQTRRIPQGLIEKYVESLNKFSLKLFPIYPGETPQGINPYQIPCHCQLGNAYQVLSEYGVDVDQELPWIRPWILRYQMPDGGLNCDSDAYLVKDEVPSSMVGTIAVFEAILLYTQRPWTAEEKLFLDKAAKFLMNRKLMFGSSTTYNASERKSAKNWLKLCFPRFYLYDVLRGLSALLVWAEKTGQELKKESIHDVESYLDQRFSTGEIKIERQAYDGVKTALPSTSGEWTKEPASLFPLLTEVSKIGSISPFLSQQWRRAKNLLG